MITNPDNNSPHDDPQDELRLKPTDPQVDSHRLAIMETHLPAESPSDIVPESRPGQFAVWHLFLAMTVAAIAASLFQWMTIAMATAVIGLVALLVLILMRVIQIRSRAFEFVFWTALGIYVVFILLNSILQ